MKFHTHHFPVGTIFVLNDDMVNHTTSKAPGEEFEVTKVVRNGPNSYVVETTKKMNPEAFGDMNQSYNISHVKAIIKRGDGPMVFEEHEFDPRDFKFLEEKHILENYYNIKTKKTHFVHWSPQDIVMFCIRDRNTNGGGIFDMEKCMKALSKQTFITLFDHAKYGIGAVSVDKKRLKRFMQQNYNRFLVKVKEAQKQQDEIDYKFYGDDDYFGSSFGLDEDPIATEGLNQDKLFPNKQEGSSHGDGSDYCLSMGDEEPRVEDEFLNEQEVGYVPETVAVKPATLGQTIGLYEEGLIQKTTATGKVVLRELLEELESEVHLGTVVEAIRDEAYRQFKEGGLSEQNLLTGQPALNKMLEGGIPAGEPWPYGLPRFTTGEISVKHLETDQVKKHEEDM